MNASSPPSQTAPSSTPIHPASDSARQAVPIHLVGIAGVGMSALAQALDDAGAMVSGSDRYLDSGQDVAVLDVLRRRGIRLTPQDGSGINPGLHAVVVSSAIEDDNADVAAARRLKVPVVHRAEMLARLCEGATLVAVTGTAGKTTVTGMIGWTLEQLGLDPRVVNGGAVVNWMAPDRTGSTRPGRSSLCVFELDESDRSLMRFHPDWAVVTNISQDHFALDEVERLFLAFARQVKLGLVGCLGPEQDRKLLQAFSPTLSADGVRFEYKGIPFSLNLPGAHNAENALHCVLLCERLGCDLRKISAALATFQGIHRRLECVGRARGAVVVDDYAHNPAKISAAWRAMAPWRTRMLAVWRPHGFGPLALMLNDLVAAFKRLARPEDRIWILPVYFAGGTAARTIASTDLVQALKAQGVNAETAENYDALVDRLGREVKDGDAVLSMGARDPELPTFARRLVERLRTSP